MHKYVHLYQRKILNDTIIYKNRNKIINTVLNAVMSTNFMLIS